MRQVFISHNRADNGWCQDFYRRLKRKARSMRFFIDFRNIPVGATWEQHLWDVFNACSVYLFVVSPNTPHSDWVREEARQAIARAQADPSCIVIPVLIGDAANLSAVDPALARYEAADFRDGSKYDETLARLVYALKHPDRLHKHEGVIVEPLPPVPWWVAFLKGVGRMYTGIPKEE